MSNPHPGRSPLQDFVAKLALAALLLPAPAAAQIDDAQIRSAVDRLAPSIIELRHQIHQNPELGNREFKTSALVAAHLRALGLEVRTGIAHTGVVAVLRGGRPGPIVAVRADMDALPVTEDTPYPFKSRVRTTYLNQDVGVAHACGHDIHTTVQLGVASTLAGMRARLPGTVVFLFQPAEEGPPPGEEGGAALMLKEGAFAPLRPSAVFGLHTYSDMDVGKVGFTSGPAMAASTGWDAVLHGKQSHGARPEASIDPIVMASQLVMALQTIRSRNLSPFTPSVITVGILRSGERRNIIPADAYLQGTLRSFDPAVEDSIERRMREIMEGVTHAAGGSFELSFDHAYPLTVNNPDLTARTRPTLERVLGKENTLEIPPTTGAEDFSYFANEVPGFFYRLGSVKPGTVSGGHHTPTFMADDGSIPVGMRVMSAVLVDYLSANQTPAGAGH